jgi:Fic family protein
MLIPLFLFERKLLHVPMFYLSEHLEARRQTYYDKLLAVSRDDDWTGWCEFFLRAVAEQATKNEDRTRRILNLYQAKKEWIVEATHSQYAIRALDFLFGNPVFSGALFLASSRIPRPTAKRILKVCVDGGFVQTLRDRSGRRSAVYRVPELLTITET